MPFSAGRALTPEEIDMMPELSVRAFEFKNSTETGQTVAF